MTDVRADFDNEGPGQDGPLYFLFVSDDGAEEYVMTPTVDDGRLIMQMITVSDDPMLDTERGRLALRGLNRGGDRQDPPRGRREDRREVQIGKHGGGESWIPKETGGKRSCAGGPDGRPVAKAVGWKATRRPAFGAADRVSPGGARVKGA